MFILQNLKEFIDNPMGKGSNAIPNRQLIKDNLNRRYEELIKNKKIKLDIYRKKDEYYFHFKLPSESDRNNFYDVVLHFTMDKEDFSNDKNLNRYYVKFFSNCPSFVYTYAYAFNLYGLFVEELSSKYDKKVLNDDPVTRNPGEIISYEKSIYFACYHLIRNDKYMNKSIINSIAKPYRKKQLVDNVKHSEQIQIEIKKETNRLKKEKQKSKEEKNVPKNNTKTNKYNKGINKIKAKKSSITKILPKRKINRK